MKDCIKKAMILFVVIALVSTSFAATAKTSEKAVEEMVPTHIKNPNPVTSEHKNNPSPLGPVIFSQLPYLPDESWSFYTSALDAGYLVKEDYWDVLDDICDIHWWGLSLVNPWAACDPTGMIFEIIFWDNSGNPMCVYQVSPQAQPTGLFYSGFEMYYWETDLTPCCYLPNGWVSIQSIQSSNGCWFLWAASDDGDLFSYQNDGILYDDLAFELTKAGPPPEPMICCDPGLLNWADVVPEGTVTGSFYVFNCGDPGSTLHWQIDSWPTWGIWTFNPPSGSLAEGDGVTVQVTVIAPPDKKSDFTGIIKVVNADDSTDFCLMQTDLTTPRNTAFNLMFFQWLLQQFPVFRFFLSL